jgi:hypothetical protein
VNAFWSVTTYNGQQFLIKNPINRYLINSPMLPSLQTGADGSLTLYIQKDSPAADKESNWPPARRPDLSGDAPLLAKDYSADPASRRRHVETASSQDDQLKPRTRHPPMST